MSDGISPDLGRIERMSNKEKQETYPNMVKVFGNDFEVDKLTRHGFWNAHIIRPMEFENILKKYVDDDFRAKFFIKHTLVKRKSK